MCNISTYQQCFGSSEARRPALRARLRSPKVVNFLCLLYNSHCPSINSPFQARTLPLGLPLVATAHPQFCLIQLTFCLARSRLMPPPAGGDVQILKATHCTFFILSVALLLLGSLALVLVPPQMAFPPLSRATRGTYDAGGPMEAEDFVLFDSEYVFTAFLVFFSWLWRAGQIHVRKRPVPPSICLPPTATAT